MNYCRQCGILACILSLGAGYAVAEKELMYDPEQGIIFVDRKAGTVKRQKKAVSGQVKRSRPKGGTKTDLHVGRKKDPPELYYKSGLEYFKNGDYHNAIKNFRYADSLEHRPEYMLFVGKALRNMGRKNDMIKVMFDILTKDPDCDVADDALLELALHYKIEDDYDKAINLFTRLIEQYPFGLAYSTGEELPVLAREQRRLMRAELINLLTTLGYKGVDLHSTMTAFQKSRNIPQTGVGDHGTMKLLREAHREFLRKEDEKVRSLQQVDKFTGWMYGAIAVGGVNVLMLFLLIFRALAHKRQVTMLMQVVSELEVKQV